MNNRDNMYQQNLFAALFYSDHGGEGVDGGGRVRWGEVRTKIDMA